MIAIVHILYFSPSTLTAETSCQTDLSIPVLEDQLYEVKTFRLLVVLLNNILQKCSDDDPDLAPLPGQPQEDGGQR